MLSLKQFFLVAMDFPARFAQETCTPLLQGSHLFATDRNASGTPCRLKKNFQEGCFISMFQAVLSYSGTGNLQSLSQGFSQFQREKPGDKIE